MPKLTREQKVIFNNLKKSRTKRFTIIEKSIHKILIARTKVDYMESVHQALVRELDASYAAAQSDAMRAGLPPSAIMFLENVKRTIKVPNEVKPPDQPEK